MLLPENRLRKTLSWRYSNRANRRPREDARRWFEAVEACACPPPARGGCGGPPDACRGSGIGGLARRYRCAGAGIAVSGGAEPIPRGVEPDVRGRIIDSVERIIDHRGEISDYGGGINDSWGGIDDSECEINDSGARIIDSRCRIIDSRHRITVFRCWIIDSCARITVSRHRISVAGNGIAVSTGNLPGEATGWLAQGAAAPMTAEADGVAGVAVLTCACG